MTGQKFLGPLVLIVAVLAGCGAPRRAASTPKPDETARAIVVHVIDGDTVVVTVGARRSRVRLLGIDAPEDTGRHDCFGRQATAELRRLLPADTPVLLGFGRRRLDPYGRTLAYVWRPDGMFVNRALVRGGFATTMLLPPTGRRRGLLLAAEDHARGERAGLWRACVNARAGPGRAA